MRFVKQLCCTVIGVLALGAPGAGASEFQAESYPVNVSGSPVGNHVLTVEGGTSITCTNASLSGQGVEPSEVFTMTPAYSGCTAFGGLVNVNVSVGGCAYVFHSGEELESGKFSGTIDVTCPPEQKMAFTAGTCKVEVGPQVGLGKVEYANNAAEPSTVTINVSLTKVKYNKVEDGALCPFSGTGEKEDGTYSGTAVASGSIEDWETEEVEAVAVSVAQGGKVKLCTKALTNKVCKAGDEWQAKTKIEGKATSATLSLVGGIQVLCKKSAITATTKDKEGNPLMAEKVTASFTVSECETSNKKACTTVAMENAETEGKIRAHGDKPGNGYLHFDVVLRLLCGGEINCKYSRTSFGGYIFGSETTAVWETNSNGLIPREKFTGEFGCTNSLTWTGSYNLTPSPLWVSY